MTEVLKFIADLMVGNGIVIVASVYVCGEIIKRTSAIDNKYIPLIGGGLGIALAVVLPNVFPDLDMATKAVYGLMLGWSATGGYETIKNITGGNEE